MSMFIVENNEIISFTDYIISESVRPKEIDYGVNEETNDKQFKKGKNFYYTVFSN